MPKVTDFFEEGGRQYLVMDFVDGQTLEQIVTATRGFIPEPTVLAWAEQLCDVLEYLHTRQPPIIFRDLKPANIMLTREGKIKLIDFGIARLKPGKAKDTAQYGTMGYAAPEQFGTGQTDARSDIYSLGVTLHYLLTKFDPALVPFNLPPARNINPLVSPQTEAVIVRATKSAGFERFQSASEMRRVLCTMPVVPAQPVVPIRPTAPVQPVAPQPAPVPPEMVLIPAGDFVMGSNDYDHEKPRHTVYLDAYYIDRYPVTNAEYKKFVDATGHRAPEHWKGGKIPTGKENHPVVYVSWDDAQAYAQWAGKRLPTEAEWEKAARGTDERRYPWGNEFDANKCNTGNLLFGGTTPVVKYSPQGDSPYGVGDMAGNVSEWVADWYDKKYYSSSPRNNPPGSSSGASRVLRGGAWGYDGNDVRAADRSRDAPTTYAYNDVGIRCARSL